MNIILPVIDNNEGKFTMAKGFHSSEDVCLYNSLDGTYDWIKTKDISSHEDNLSVSLKRRNVFTIITSHMPFLAMRLFQESGLLVYKSKGTSVEENIALFTQKELEAFTPQIYSGTTYSACGSCSSSSCGPSCK